MIKITFPNSRGDRLYFPEETISGQATWDPKYEHKKAEIRLFWYTQGKGDVDIQIIDKIEIPNPSEGKAFFKFNLPKEPYSFSGKLISLIWAIELVFFPSKESFKADFAMSPSGQEIDLYQKPILKDS
jgi:hypothetical protein